MNTRILLIEADHHLRKVLMLNLHNVLDYETDSIPVFQHRYCISTASSGVEGLMAVRQVKPDLILLGTGFADLPGVEICRRLRATGYRAPIIVLGAGHDVRECIAGLNAGASDYLLRPFSIEELRARMRSRLRRATMEDKNTQLRFESLTLDQATREVYCHQHAIELTTKEFALLAYFMLHPRQVMTRAQILNRVWADSPEADRSILDVYVHYLRVKLEHHHNQRLLHTVRSVGYVLREPLLKQSSTPKNRVSALA